MKVQHFVFKRFRFENCWVREECKQAVLEGWGLGMDAITVQELLALNPTRWDLDLVQAVFCDRDVQLIQSIPLSSRPRLDWWKWRWEWKGLYSVKSAYKMLQDCVSVTDEGGCLLWCLLWHLQAGINNNLLFSACGVCGIAGMMWFGASGYPLPLRSCQYKCNFDASLDASTRRISCGSIIRDHQGNILHVFAQVFDGPPYPSLAEAIGMKAVLSWLKLTPIHCHVIESDCLLLVNALKNVVYDLSYVGVIVSDYKALFHELRDIDVCHVKRSANKTTHAIAREELFQSDFVSWGQVFPPFVTAVTCSECPSTDVPQPGFLRSSGSRSGVSGESVDSGLERSGCFDFSWSSS
ncbi:hypothetical protein K2173_004506 [Erythroxylum novogranatense]|uniref:RNase H type-1 domain-containing protein n=1 Tax=Erythroxylum novogranatense TaxID=1862640 RepID=A0AAV8TIL5_9ROSI|nr:hypothetical protein K2173_004506 [Erythroxylum novogranatense]